MPGIFISYRRSESAGHAGRLFDRLAARFGDDRVFMDVDALSASEHYAARIDSAIANADVVLVLIGPKWASSVDRLRMDDDFIRHEILVALQFERPLVPVQLDGAELPAASALPKELQPLLACESAVLRHGEFIRDADHLADSLAKLVDPSPDAPRRCLAAALVRCGAPVSWAAGLIRRTSPRAALAMATSAIAIVWALTSGTAYWLGRGHEPDVLTQLQVSDGAVNKTAGHLSGTVTDETDRSVDDATVTLRNLDNDLSSAATTDSSGQFDIAYQAVKATAESRLELVVTKPHFTRFREAFVGTTVRYRRSIRHEAEVAHAQ